MSNVPEPRRPEKRRATKAEHVAFHKEETERQRIQAEEDRIREEQRRLKEEEEARKFQQELNDGILARDLAAQQTEQATKISNLVKEGSKLAKQAVKQAHNSGRLYEPVLTPYQRLVKLKEDKERELQEKAAAKKEEKKQKQLKRLEKKEKKMEEMLRKKALQQAAAAENQEGDGDQDKPKEGNKSTAQDDEEANRRKKHRKKKKAKRRLKKKEEEKKASAIPLYAECNRWTLGKYVIHKEPKKETEDERRQRDYKQYKREFVRPTVPPAPSLPSRVPHLEILCRAKSMMPSLLKIHGINIDKMILDYEKRNGKVPQRPPEGWLPKDHLERMAARTDYKYDPNEKPAFTWHKFYDTPLPSSYPLPRPSTNEELRTEYIYHPSHDGSDVSPDEILPSPQGEDENLPFYSDRPYVFHTYEAFWNEAARAGVPDMLENLFNELIANDHYFNEHIQDEMRKYFKTCASPPTFQQLVDHFKSAAFRLVSVDVKKTLALVVSDLYEKLGNKHKEARNRQEQKWTSESDKRQSDCRKATEQRFRDMSGEWKKARDAVLQKKTEHEEFKRIRQQRRQEIRRQERRQQPDPFQSSEEESDGDPEDDRVSSDEEEVKKNFDKTLENMSKPVPGFEEPEEPLLRHLLNELRFFQSGKFSRSQSSPSAQPLQTLATPTVTPVIPMRSRAGI
ncbi:hypothetical protein L596_006120 [Steinernema carpocapsae]|uniref:Uncharacterized protein n=1 Tax=Steinernema carpocapsae TaxID=34508 RepID=A0A4U8V6N2_STECR|nr:hypothetical protein L596_006120 [Steinernema carpocapsae]